MKEDLKFWTPFESKDKLEADKLYKELMAMQEFHYDLLDKDGDILQLSWENEDGEKIADFGILYANSKYEVMEEITRRFPAAKYPEIKNVEIYRINRG